jgi:hypothetical protein
LISRSAIVFFLTLLRQTREPSGKTPNGQVQSQLDQVANFHTALQLVNNDLENGIPMASARDWAQYREWLPIASPIYQ